MNNFRYSDAGLSLTKRYEGLRLKAYQDSGGIWTVGYGHTGPDVRAGREVTALEAEALLRADLRSAIDCVNAAVKVPLAQNHFDALVDFTYNAGRGSFLRSALLQRLNKGDLAGADDQFALWIHVNGQPSRGLQRRRAAESAMFRGVYRANSIA
jgi:lysozyme